MQLDELLILSIGCMGLGILMVVYALDAFIHAHSAPLSKEGALEPTLPTCTLAKNNDNEPSSLMTSPQGDFTHAKDTVK